jgi:serine/threonine protein phosphatase PrpC
MAVADLKGPHLWPQTFLAVFDGHGGAQASEYLWDNLHLKIAESLHNRAAQLNSAAQAIDTAAAASASTSTTTSSNDVDRFAELDKVVKEAFQESFRAIDDAFITGSEHPQASCKLSLNFFYIFTMQTLLFKA